MTPFQWGFVTGLAISLTAGIAGSVLLYRALFPASDMVCCALQRGP